MLWDVFFFVWVVISWSPCALLFNSSLYGYGVVWSFFCLVGLESRVYPLLLMVGFKNEENALRCSFASFVLILLQTLLILFDVGAELFLPFASAVAVIGNNTYFMSLMILSFASEKYSGFFCVMMAISVLVLHLTGQVLAIAGMANVSITYGVLWGMMKYGQFHLERNFNIWLLLLISSVAVWRLSLYLHLHPEYVTCLFGM